MDIKVSDGSLPVSIDGERGIITLAGIRYDMELFKAFGFGPLNRSIRLFAREDGVVTLQDLPDWRPIAEAPLETWTRDLPGYYRYRCLIQTQGHGDVQHVQEGWGYWFKARHPNSEPVVRWASMHGLCTPKYFMPLPAAKED